MDIVNKILNIYAAHFTRTVFPLFFPAYLYFKSLQYIWRSIYREDVAGKVVVIAGASSGIGEHLAYEYGRRGAYLVIGARRENALHEVAERACRLSSLYVVPVQTDVSKVEDCKQLIQTAIGQFGRLDHLVMTAGIASVAMFEDTDDLTNFAPIMDTNFWGQVYTTYFAAPHLRKTKGKIVVFSSSISWLNEPRLSFYAASKAAIVSFFESLRIEFAPDIGITIVTPGIVESEMSKGKILNKDGKIVVDQEMRDVVLSAAPMVLAKKLAKATVDSACRGDKYLTVPFWFETTFFVRMLCPELTDWLQRWFYVTRPEDPPTEAISKKIIDLLGMKDILWPDSVRSPKIKCN